MIWETKLVTDTLRTLDLAELYFYLTDTQVTCFPCCTLKPAIASERQHTHAGPTE